MKYILITILFTAILSCTQEPQELENEFSINWLMEYNEAFLLRIETTVEAKGNRGPDSVILAKSKILTEKCNVVLNSIYDQNKKELILSLKEGLPEYLELKSSFDQFIDSTKLHQLKIQEIKKRILLFELQSLTNLNARIGAKDIAFNKLDAFYIPENYQNSQSKKIKGKVILTAMSDQMDQIVDFYFDNQRLAEADGVGIVDVNKNQLTNEDSVEIKIKFPTWEIKKMVLIK